MVAPNPINIPVNDFKITDQPDESLLALNLFDSMGVSLVRRENGQYTRGLAHVITPTTNRDIRRVKTILDRFLDDFEVNPGQDVSIAIYPPLRGGNTEDWSHRFKKYLQEKGLRVYADDDFNIRTSVPKIHEKGIALHSGRVFLLYLFKDRIVGNRYIPLKDLTKQTFTPYD